MPFAKREVQELTCPVSTHVVGTGEQDPRGPGRAQPQPLPAALPSATAAIPPALPAPDFLLLAFVLSVLAKSPKPLSKQRVW